MKFKLWKISLQSQYFHLLEKIFFGNANKKKLKEIELQRKYEAEKNENKMTLFEHINQGLKAINISNHIQENFSFAKNIHYDNNNEINFGIIDKENISEKQKVSMNIWLFILKDKIKVATNNAIDFNDLENYDFQDVINSVTLKLIKIFLVLF